MHDHVQRFLFDDLGIRGAIVKLNSVWRQLLQRRDYSAPLVHLLGEMSAVTLFLADNLKETGRLTLQLQGKAPLSLLVVDCSDALNLRCMAHCDESIENVPLSELFSEGKLSLVLETASMKKPYQSIVPLDGESVAQIFEHYLKQSEQLPSRFFLAASETSAAGLFIQKMPDADTHDADGWARIEALASTVKPEELLILAPETLLYRLFNEDANASLFRVFSPKKITHDFPKDHEKVSHLLQTLGREEVYGALKDQGVIVIHDELSNHEYRFDKTMIDAIFAQTMAMPPTIH